MKKALIFLAILILSVSCAKEEDGISIPEIRQVKVNDTFWTPRLNQWNQDTMLEILDKFEADGAIENFDLVAEGRRNLGKHGGPPWYDGLVYEMIRAAADFIQQAPNPKLEERIDEYTKHIAAAQENEGTGYINTYTLLMYSDRQWGKNGGSIRWQHDVYNSGALVDAGVHYFRATGKRELLDIAIRLADYMCDYMGEYPKENVVPAHSLPEEAFVSLYELTGEKKYLDLVKFWLGARGRHGYEDGLWSRDNLEAYSQDDRLLTEQTSIEGHAVRATLLYTGTADYTRVSGDTTYRKVVERIWDNMACRKMMVTGAVGSVAEEEKFGDDFFIPVNAYAETCAGVGLAFFSQQMNQLCGGGKYMDEFERALYNNILTGISLDGQTFTYVNPLNATNYNRWSWHGCPCCPPMFMKMMSALPSYIYATDNDGIYVNLYIGSESEFEVKGTRTGVTLETSYPWKGDSRITVSPSSSRAFAIRLRIPGWATGKENPLDLYVSETPGDIKISVNGNDFPVNIVNGYASIERKWSDGDIIDVSLPVSPRIIHADPRCDMGNTAAIAAGPVVYCFEVTDNPELERIKVSNCLEMAHDDCLLRGVNTIACGEWTAIPYFSVGNRQKDSSYLIWTPEE